MANMPDRRALIGALAVAPAAMLAAPATARSTKPVPDVRWQYLVADYRAKHRAWYATIDVQEEASAAFRDARKALPPEPAQPASVSSDDMQNMTLREITGLSDAPAHQAAWAAYQRDHAAWRAEHDALREKIVAPAEAAYNRLFQIRVNALSALSEYRVTNLRDLGEKIEIVMDDQADEIPLEFVDDILADVRHLAGRA